MWREGSARWLGGGVSNQTSPGSPCLGKQNKAASGGPLLEIKKGVGGRRLASFRKSRAADEGLWRVAIVCGVGVGEGGEGVAGYRGRISQEVLNKHVPLVLFLFPIDRRRRPGG